MEPALKFSIAQLSNCSLTSEGYRLVVRSDTVLKIKLVWIQGTVVKVHEESHMLVVKDFSCATALIVRTNRSSFKYAGLAEGHYVCVIGALESISNHTSPVIAADKIQFLAHCQSSSNADSWSDEIRYVHSNIMGGWKLEVFKMVTYVTFPLIMLVAYSDPQVIRPLVIREYERYPERMRNMDPNYKSLKDKESDFQQYRENEKKSSVH